MLQVIQYQKTGKISVEELPRPTLRPGGVLVQNLFSLISSGTERTSVETAQASLLGKAKSRPDLVRQVLRSAKRDGVVATYRKVQTRLDSYKQLGYSSAGLVVESSVDAFKAGDRVACAGYAHHAEFIVVPKNLVVKIPDSVSYEEAAFATVGAIALQGVRQADVRIGELAAVIGLGLIGLLTVQLLKASGCKVIGLDISKSNFDLARELGCDECTLSTPDFVGVVERFTKGCGTDAVLLTAATRSNEPMELALQFARKRSRVVVVGDVGMRVPRSPFYEKELELKISCSYGPGRYDPEYEENGNDYPIGYVRWTENRNMEAVLDLIAQKKLDVRSLITHKFPIQEALRAYDLILGKVKEKHVGILIEYPRAAIPAGEALRKVEVMRTPRPLIRTPEVVVGFIGAGNFAQAYLLPPLQKLGVRLKGVATLTPAHAKAVAKKFHFEYCSADGEEILKDPEINTVFIATRHDSHASYVCQALKEGKNVFVEKPLAINDQQLEEIRKAYDTYVERRPALLTGFNRRFSKPFKDIKRFFGERKDPLFITYRVNAGFLPQTHWIHTVEQGGRIVGEACHFIDCMTFLTEGRPVRVYAEALENEDSQRMDRENVSVSIKFSDGSLGNLLYVTNGDNAVAKEYCEVTSGGKTALMMNFEEVHFYEHGKRKKIKYDGSKGHKEEVEHLVAVAMGKEPPALSFESIYDTTLATLKIMQSLKERVALET